MNAEHAHWSGMSFSLSQLPGPGGVLRVMLTGALGIADVEIVADWADRVCGMPARDIRLELAGLLAVDDAGARTLAAACHCLRLNNRGVQTLGTRPDVAEVLDRLGLALDGRDRQRPARTRGAPRIPA
jgi:anti-anti-sigma regulatory factor